MPIKKKSGETKNDYVSRCISHEVGKGHEQQQAIAMCESMWEQENMSDEKFENYELTIDDINYDGVTAISIVEFPAIEENFLVFSKEKCNFLFAKANTDKRIITGPALICNKDIYRINPFTGQEYYVHFTADTVKQISENFLIQNRNSNVTLEHESNVNDVSIIESWIVENPKMDKSNALGYSLEKGSWMVSLKVNNDELWNNVIKQGKVKGFSIEGYFTTKFDKYSKQEEPQQPLETIEQILQDKDLDKIKVEKIRKILEELD